MTGILSDILSSIFGRRRPVPTPVVPPAPPNPPSPPTPPPTPIAAASAPALHRAINAARAAHGLPALRLDPLISTVAATWAARVAGTGVLDHGNFASRITSVAPGKPAGENLGIGFPSAEAEVRGWLADPPHKAVLLGRWDMVGVGVGVGRDGRFVFCADFVLDD